MTYEQAKDLLTTYGEAWINRDPDLILSIFTPDATYNDPRELENQGHGGIRAYWVSKVVGGQKDIKLKLLNIWIDDETVIAEWEAEFIDTKRNLKIKMTEVAIFTVKENKFASLREYYKSTKTPLENI